MANVKVRLSIRPHEETAIPEDEIPGLRAQGLLVEGEPGAPETTAVPASPAEPEPPRTAKSAGRKTAARKQEG